MKKLVIVDNVHNLIENWRSYRKQRILINGTALQWSPVTSGVLQGCVLKLLPFMIYIDNIDVGLNLIAKFGDDARIGNSLISDSDRQTLQEDA